MPPFLFLNGLTPSPAWYLLRCSEVVVKLAKHKNQEKAVLVDRIVADRWRGTRCEQDVTLHPSLDDFMRTFDALDGGERTMLCLYSSKSRRLTIGGGDGKYVVYASLPEDEFWNLLSDIAENRTIMVNAGGQEGDFPARQVVDEMCARRAGTTFMRDGELDHSLRWEKAKVSPQSMGPIHP